MSSTAPTPTPLIPLTTNEKRLLSLLVSSVTVPILRQRFSPNPAITQLHERLIDGQNSYEEYEKLTVVLNPIFLEPGEGETPQEAYPPPLYQYIQAAIERLLKVRNNILRLLLYTHQVVSFNTDILGRGPNGIATLRSHNICQNCGYGGHWPVECPEWRCPTCHTWGPGHAPQNCPHYIPPYPGRRTVRRMRPMPTRRPTPRPTQRRPLAVPPPQRQPLSDQTPPGLAPLSDSDSDQENRMLLPTERYYNSTASDSLSLPHLPTISGPRIVIETTTADPSPQPHFSPLQVNAQDPNEHEQPTEAMLQRVLHAIDAHPTPAMTTQAHWDQLRQAFEPSGSQTTVINGMVTSDNPRTHMGLEPGEETEEMPQFFQETQGMNTGR